MESKLRVKLVNNAHCNGIPQGSIGYVYSFLNHGESIRAVIGFDKVLVYLPIHMVEVVVDPVNIKRDHENTTVREWVEKTRCSKRLYNIIIHQKIPYYEEGEWKTFSQIMVSELTREVFMLARNAGVKSWEEFVKLRGY